MASSTEDAARRELLTALDERDPSAIRAAMVSYADKVQGVRLQAKAYDLVARLNDDKAAELDKLIVEMRQMAMQRRASLEAEAATAALAAKEAAAAAAAAAAVEAAEWAAAEAEMESVEAPVPLVDERTLKLFEAALWELAEGDGEEAGVRDSEEGSGDVSEPLDHSIGGSLDASARHVHAADSLSRDVAGKMSLEEEAILNNLDNLPGAADRSHLVRNLENIIHRTDG